MISSFLLTRSPGNGPPEPHIVNTHLGPRFAHLPQLGASGPPHRLQTPQRPPHAPCPMPVQAGPAHTSGSKSSQGRKRPVLGHPSW